MKRNILAIAGTVLGLLLATARTGISQDTNAASKLVVHVGYSGAGTVDEKHKIYIAVWDSPDFMKSGDVMPIASQSTSSKNGAVTFDNLTKAPVYVSAAYDPTGQWDAQSPPPEGTSLGLYSKTPGTPEPVDLRPGKTVSIELPFDDSVKMKAGQPTK